MTASVALDVVVFLYAFALPGLLVAYYVLRLRDVTELIPIGACLGLFGLPIIDYTLAVLLRTHIGPMLVLATSTAAIAATATYVVVQRRKSA